MTERSSPTHSPVSQSPAAWRSRSAWTVLIISTLLALALDLGSKHLAFAHIAPDPVVVDRSDVMTQMAKDVRGLQALVPLHKAVTPIPHILEFKLVLNGGAVFGSGQGRRWFFIGFTGVALLFAIYLFARWTRANERWSHIAIGLILSGGLGNLYDRLTLACVRDFIHPLPGVTFPFGLSLPGGQREIWPYVSNVADAALLVGIIFLLIRIWRDDKALQSRQAELARE